MKKHPVDELFERRLSGLERKPSPNAWQRIEEAREQKRKPALWIWYAAASVLVAALAGYLTFDHQKTADVAQQVAVVPPPARPEMPEKPQTSDILPADRSGIAPENSQAANEEVANYPKTIKELRKKVSKPVNAEKPAEAEKYVEIEVQHIAAVEPAANREMVKREPIVEMHSSAVNALSQPEPSRTIVVAVETEEEISAKKISKFSKLFRQLKNARAGERVDWEEVGFNPKDLVAKVDDRLRTRDEKTSEKNQK